MPACCLPACQLRRKAQKAATRMENMEQSFSPLAGLAQWLTKQLRWVQLSSQQDMFSISTFPLLFSCFSYNNAFILTIQPGSAQYIHVEWERWIRGPFWSVRSLGWGKVMDPEAPQSCLLLGQQSISQPRPACLQGLRPAFIPRSSAKADTPPGHEERGMHSDPPPSSPLSLQRSRDGGPFMESNQDPRHQISLFSIPLFTSSPFALFLPPLCEGCLQW